MQDRYAGDVGDFLKFVTLRRLSTSADGGPTFRLGIVWYRANTAEANDDGKHITYLARRTVRDIGLCSIDEELAECLAQVANAEARSIAALQVCGALAPSTTYHDEPLSWDGLAPFQVNERLHHRAEWLRRGIERTREADLVFLDPDNGVRSLAHKLPRTRKTSVKHVYLDEIRPFLDRGQSVVVYHHAGRTGSVEHQVEKLKSLAARELGIPPVAVVRASRGTVRLFVVLAHPDHESVLRERAAALDGLGGAGALTVYL